MKILHAWEGIPPCETVSDLVHPDEDPLTLANYPALQELSHVLPRGVELRKPKWILDLGANYGYSTWELAREYPGARIVAVEIDEENCDVLLKNVYQFGEQVTVINAAVMSRPGVVRYDGLGRTTYTTLATSPDKKAEAVTIDQIMEEVGCPYWDYIKMDIEGSEHEIMRSAAIHETPWLKQTHVIKVEVHEHYPEMGLVPNPGDHVEKAGTIKDVKDVLEKAYGYRLVDEDHIRLTFKWHSEPLPMGHPVGGSILSGDLLIPHRGRLPNVMGQRVIDESAPIPLKFSEVPDTGGLPSLRPMKIVHLDEADYEDPR